MEDKRLWIHDPPEGSAEDWARVYEALIELAGRLVPEDLHVPESNQLPLFALQDVIERCGHEAERRDPGITQRRLRTDLENTRAYLQEFDV